MTLDIEDNGISGRTVPWPSKAIRLLNLVKSDRVNTTRIIPNEAKSRAGLFFYTPPMATDFDDTNDA